MTRFNRFYFLLVTITLIGGANVILGVTVTLMEPSGQFMSIGYPNSESDATAWRITVEEGYQINLEFVDFQLNETDGCHRDNIRLFDAANVDDSRLIGKWCWNNFTKLMPNTFTSPNNSLFLIFRGYQGYTRKGFKATYFSFNSSLLTTAESTSQVPSTTVRPINPGTHPGDDNVIATAPLTRVIIIAGVGVVILSLCIVVVCIICLLCNRRSKRKNKEPVDIPPYDTNNQVTSGNILNQSQDSNIIQQRDESGGRVYNVPSNEEGSASDNYDDIRCSRHIDVCIDSPQKQNGGDLRNEKLLDNNVQMSNLKGSPYDKKQSNSTKETGSDVVDDIQAYSCVDVTNILTQPENVEVRYDKDDVTYSLPVKNKRESEEMCYNVTYESYDS